MTLRPQRLNNDGPDGDLLMCNFFPRGTLAATDSFDVFNGYQQDVPISLFLVDNRTAVCGDVVIARQRSRDRQRLV